MAMHRECTLKATGYATAAVSYTCAVATPSCCAKAAPAVTFRAAESPGSAEIAFGAVVAALNKYGDSKRQSKQLNSSHL